MKKPLVVLLAISLLLGLLAGCSGPKISTTTSTDTSTAFGESGNVPTPSTSTSLSESTSFGELEALNPDSGKSDDSSSGKPSKSDGVNHTNPYGAFFRGAIRVEEREGTFGDILDGGGSFIPLRFSNSRLAAYDAYPRAPYARCTTGVRLDFTTSAAEISFRYSITAHFFDGKQPTETMDFYVDGSLSKKVQIDYVSTRSETVSLSLPAGSHRVTVYLPAWHGLALSNLNLGTDAAPINPTGKKYLILSDSIGQGLFADGASGSYVSRLMRELDAEYLNLSVGGDTFLASNLDSDIPFAPDRIFISLGINDYVFSRQDHGAAQIDTIKSNAMRYLSTVRSLYPSAEILVMTPIIEVDPALQTAVLEACSSAGVRVVRGTDYFSGSSSLLSDGVHPNSEGREKLAESLLPLFRESSWS